MPELPEVETVVRTLRPKLLGATIARAEVRDDLVIAGSSPEDFCRALAGRTIGHLRRRGKFAIAPLGEGLFLVAHLGMTGQLVLAPAMAPEPRFARVALHLEDGHTLWYADMRKFGRLRVTQDAEAVTAGLGPEPLHPSFDAAVLLNRTQGRKRPIKSLLLDQSVVAGLGNIYADEALFEAGLNPCTPAGDLTGDQANRLVEAIRGVLTRGIANRGTTISDYVDGEGRPGANQLTLRVYGRAGQACVHCGRPLSGIRLAGRSTCFCPECQPLAPGSPAER